MKDTDTSVNPYVIAGVLTLCVVTCVLIFLLPADALVVDLIYQGF